MAKSLRHGDATAKQVKETFERMAAAVNDQNAGDLLDKSTVGHLDTGAANQAASDLLFKNLEQPSGTLSRCRAPNGSQTALSKSKWRLRMRFLLAV